MAESINVYGQIFSVTEADERFGPVLKSIPIPTSEVRDLLTRTTASIMFKIIDNDLIIVDNERSPLLLQGNHEITAETVFSLYSTSVVNELLDNGKDTTTKIEQRKEVLSVTNGNLTMEVAGLCPPICH